MMKPHLRVAFMKALGDTNDKSIGAKAYLVRRLWRSPDPEINQAARVVLRMVKPEVKSPKGLSVARLVKTELLDQGEDWTKPRHKVLTVVYGIIADRIGLKDRTVKENYERYRAKIPEAEAKEQEALLKKLEAEAKAQTDALFYRDAAKWGPEE